MANKRFWLGLLVTVLAFGMMVVGCGDGTGGGETPTSPTYSLDGVWENSSQQITVSSSTGTGVFSKTNFTSPLMVDAVNKSFIHIGGQKWHNLINAGNLRWSGEQLLITYTPSNPNVATGITWTSCTITMSSNGQTINVNFTDSDGTKNETYTRVTQ